MPELATHLLKTSLDALRPQGTCCADCRRTPLPGEHLHELEGGRKLCELCFAMLPEDGRTAISIERVGASERRLVVARPAA
jgi:hypothetical protein